MFCKIKEFLRGDEEFGFMTLEVLANGTLVISLDLSAFKVMVKSGLTSFRVLNLNSEDYTKAVLKPYELWKRHLRKCRSLCQNVKRESSADSLYRLLLINSLNYSSGNGTRLIKEGLVG